jgi:hypothetical protein
MRRFTTVLTVLLGLFPVSFGLQFLLDGHGAASSFGIDPWPTGAAAGYFAVKGIRDMVLGLNFLVLLALGQRRAAGIVMAVAVPIAFTDAIVVLTHGGSLATALGIHVLTGLVVLADAWLLLRERPVAETSHPTPVPAHS